MKIGVSFAALVNTGGIGRYARLLARHLPRKSPGHDFVAYVPSFREEKTDEVMRAEGIEGWRKVVVQAGNRWSFDAVRLALRIIEDPPDIFHGPDYLAPAVPCPVCVTVHDLAFRLHPAGMNLKSLYLFRRLAPGSISRAASTGTVFSDSKATLDDLRRLKWVGPDDGVVVPLACEDGFREPVPEDRIVRLVEKEDIPRNYVLYVGPIERRKNLGVLVNAYRLVGQVLKRREDAVPALVAAGPLGSGGRRIRKQLEKQGDGLFVHLGYLPREDLITLYAGCRFFCYPSRYEGFGLPPLEAMSAGKAVIVSNASSLPEVVGTAGILVDPDDIPGWSTEILNLLTNEKRLLETEEACRKRSLEFSVDRMCDEVMSGYERAFGKSRKS